MKKSANVDISNLFRKFGGDTGSYKEIQQDYIGEKAQKSWPIVQAVEKERAIAPRLKTAGGAAATQPVHPVARHVAHLHQPAQAVSSPATPFDALNAAQAAPAPVRSLFGNLTAAQSEPAAQARPLFGGAVQSAVPAARPLFGGAAESAAAPASPLFGAAAQPEAVPASTSSIFSALAGSARSEPVEAVPARALFGASATAAAQPDESVRRPENDALDAVFARLLNPQQPTAASEPEHNLRSMLGFLKK